MKLSEFKELPKKAGMAEIKWVDTHHRTKADRMLAGHDGRVMRIGDQIILPADSTVEFFPLRDGDQFLFYDGLNHGASGGRVYFGGTDEKPFLVRMNPQILTTIRLGGEIEFFDRLRPREISRFEQLFGVKAIRQGDWHAVPLPWSWKEITGLHELLTRQHLEVQTRSMSEILQYKVDDPEKQGKAVIMLNNTRHKLEGKWAEVIINTNGGRNCIIGEGLLTAPDHKPVELKGPHALYQTECLLTPSQAD